MQIKQEGELQLQEQQALGVEAWAAGQPDIGEEPWGLSQLDSGAGDVSTDTASGEWRRLGVAPLKMQGCRDAGPEGCAGRRSSQKPPGGYGVWKGGPEV